MSLALDDLNPAAPTSTRLRVIDCDIGRILAHELHLRRVVEQALGEYARHGV